MGWAGRCLKIVRADQATAGGDAAASLSTVSTLSYASTKEMHAIPKRSSDALE